MARFYPFAVAEQQGLIFDKSFSHLRNTRFILEYGRQFIYINYNRGPSGPSGINLFHSGTLYFEELYGEAGTFLLTFCIKQK